MAYVFQFDSSRSDTALKRRFPVGESPTRRTLQPEATGAVTEAAALSQTSSQPGGSALLGSRPGQSRSSRSSSFGSFRRSPCNGHRKRLMHPLATADARPGWGGSILKLRSCGWRMSHNFQITEARMKKSNDLSKSLAPFEPDSSLVVVVELSQSSWLVAGRAASLDRQPTPIGVMGNASSPNAVDHVVSAPRK